MADKVDKLYHEEIFVPDDVKEQANMGFSLNLDVTSHARDKARDNKYMTERDRKFSKSRLSIPDHVHVMPDEIFEYGVDEDGELVKIGFRKSHVETVNCKGDYSNYELVLITDISGYTKASVVTLYLNRENDVHHSLNPSNYSKSPP